MNHLRKEYKTKKRTISRQLSSFSKLSPRKYHEELQFCLLTPQSKATSCWQAIEQLKKLKNPTKSQITKILRSKTRFHNNKTNYLIQAKKQWPDIKKQLSQKDSNNIRDWLADNIKGLGMKESSHFLRNIGKSDNQIAILDRHILRNLTQLGLLKQNYLPTSKKQYKKTENTFLALADYLKIPADHLDLLFWSKETGEVFK